ncbi:MAG: hypothetical protein IJ083_09750 [Clostridia bacterium]|nr:hypothetical protein [Clostridia bacterium]
MKQRGCLQGMIFLLAFLCLVFSVKETARAQVQAGDMLQFGYYEQDGVEENGKEPILWRVLSWSEEDQTALLLSEYALDCVPYNAAVRETSWIETDLRAFLQETFLQEAFTLYEQSCLVPHASGAREDLVTLLSAQEIDRYLKGNLLCEATPYARSRGVYHMDVDGRETCSWWVRMDRSETYGLYVGAMGIVRQNSNRVTAGDNGVRPAILLKLPDPSQRPVSVQTLGQWESGMQENLLHLRALGTERSGSLRMFPVGRQDRLMEAYAGSGAGFVTLTLEITNLKSTPWRVTDDLRVLVSFDGGAYMVNGFCFEERQLSGSNTAGLVPHTDTVRLMPGERGTFRVGAVLPDGTAGRYVAFRIIAGDTAFDCTAGGGNP